MLTPKGERTAPTMWSMSHSSSGNRALSRISVTLSTHSEGGVTDKDVEVAELIERQVTWHPAGGSSLTGPKKPFVKPDAAG